MPQKNATKDLSCGSPESSPSCRGKNCQSSAVDKIGVSKMEAPFSVLMDNSHYHALSEGYIKKVQPDAVNKVTASSSVLDVSITHQFRAHFRSSSPTAPLHLEAQAPGYSIKEILQSHTGTASSQQQQQKQQHDLHARWLSNQAQEESFTRNLEYSCMLMESTVSDYSVRVPGGRAPPPPATMPTETALPPIHSSSRPFPPLPLPLPLTTSPPPGLRKLSSSSSISSTTSTSIPGSLQNSSIWEIDSASIQIGRRIGVGGYGEVFLGKYQGTLIAVKLLLHVDDAATQRFRHEIETLMSLRHPNLILFMGYTVHPHLAIVTEYMQRGSLFRVLRKGGNVPLEPRLQRTVAVSVGRGMAYIHSRSPPLIHLDLTSSNILVDSLWRVKISDFGLSKSKFAAAVSASGQGTPGWLAPEVLRSEKHDEKADVYSYGVLLWEILTGQIPCEGMHPLQVVASIGFQGQTLPLPANADPFLADMCYRCMALNPSQRPNFPEILQALESEYDSTQPHFQNMLSTLDGEELQVAQPPTSDIHISIKSDAHGGVFRSAVTVPQSTGSLSSLSPFAAAGMTLTPSLEISFAEMAVANNNANDNGEEIYPKRQQQQQQAVPALTGVRVSPKQGADSSFLREGSDTEVSLESTLDDMRKWNARQQKKRLPGDVGDNFNTVATSSSDDLGQHDINLEEKVAESFISAQL